MPTRKPDAHPASLADRNSGGLHSSERGYGKNADAVGLRRFHNGQSFLSRYGKDSASLRASLGRHRRSVPISPARTAARHPNAAPRHRFCISNRKAYEFGPVDRLSDTNQNRKTMATTKFKDMPVHLSGDFIATGAAAPDFELVKTDLGTLSLSSLKGKRVILNIFPSLDTGVCAMSVRKFNQLAASLPDTVVLAISKDLPFAHARFCTVEGIENLVPLSDFRHSDFDENYGVLMADGPLQGLLARSVVVIDREGKVVYTELVPEITQEPDYDRAVEAAKRA